MINVFTLNGIVVGYGSANQLGAAVSHDTETGDYSVEDGTQVGVGWTVTVNNGVPTFTPSTAYPILTPIQYYNAFTIAEAIAIKNSTDPFVQEFWYRLNMLITNPDTATSTIVDPNTVQVSTPLGYLSTTNQQPVPSTGAATYIQPARVAQISNGIPQ